MIPPKFKALATLAFILTFTTSVQARTGYDATLGKVGGGDEYNYGCWDGFTDQGGDCMVENGTKWRDDMLYVS